METVEIVILIGRIMFAALFVGSGIGHLTQTDATAKVASEMGIGPARLAAQASGVVLLACGLGVALGIFMDIALLGIAVSVLVLGVMIHPFWKMEREKAYEQMPHFMKNLSLAGAAIALFGFIAWSGYDSQAITEPLLSLR